MSLISVKNFAAPFTKRGYLFTLVLVVLLFAILRISIPTGDASFSPRDLRSALTIPSGTSAVSGAAVSGVPSRVLPATIREPMHVRGATESTLQGSAAAGFFDMAPAEAPSAHNAGLRDASAEDQDVLGEILGNSTGAENKQPPAAQRNPGQLDDVEKMVGIR